MNERAPVTHGVTSRALHTGGFSIVETSHEPRTRLAPHAHEHAAITLVLEGSFEEDFGAGYRHSCGMMSALVKPAGAPHSNRYGDMGARSLILEYTGDPALFQGLEQCAPQVGLVTVVPLMLSLREVFSTMAVPERDIAVQELALEILARITACGLRPSPHAPRWLAPLVDELHARCADPVSLVEVAERIGVHPVYLARAFRRHTGRTIGAFVRQSRAQLAMSLLATTDAPISRVAHETGFADQSHLTRTLSLLVAETPAAFRRRARRTSRLAS